MTAHEPATVRIPIPDRTLALTASAMLVPFNCPYCRQSMFDVLQFKPPPSGRLDAELFGEGLVRCTRCDDQFVVHFI